MDIFVEGVRNAEFLVGWSGDTNLTRSGGYVDTSVSLQSGTPLMSNGAKPAKLVEWDGSVGTLVGLLLLHSPAEGGGVPNRRVAYVSGGPQAVTDKDGRIPYPAGVTPAQLKAALAALDITLID